MRPLFLCLLLLLSGTNVLAQNSYSSNNKKAVRSFDEGLRFYNSKENIPAINSFLEALKEDPGFVEAHIILADIFLEKEDFKKASEHYKKAFEINPKIFPVGWFNLGLSYMNEGSYAEALDAFNTYFTFKGNQPGTVSKALKRKEDCLFALEALKHPVPFSPENLGASVNSEYDDYWPSLSADEQTLVFTVLRPKNMDKPVGPGNQQEDFYFTQKSNKEWVASKPLGFPINTPDNEGAQSLTSDGKTMYFTACNRADGKGQCDIYVAFKTKEGWSLAKNLGSPVNTAGSEKQPSISSDGRFLYFVSNRAGGKGALDIWVSEKQSDGNWSAPANLGDSINTIDNEQSPFIHSDNRTLYFSSNGHTGMGGFDLYKSVRKGNQQWSKPKNLGYPINSWKDEVGLIVNTSGDRAYFTSNRQGSRKNDLYTFELYQDARPIPTSYMKGQVFDSDTKKPLQAVFELIDLSTEELVNKSNAEPSTGEFTLTLPADKDYVLNVSHPGYLFFSENFSLTSHFDPDHPFLMDIPLKPVKAGEKVVLKNIFFEINSSQLKPESKIEIEKLFGFLEMNPSIIIEIGGHTDNVGSSDYNQKLSENRAKVVAEYLINKGIDKSRIQIKGYGESQPVADNNLETGRAQNRRTEFKVIR